jgi:uncharacterized protein (DUF4213/DUF364 family)
MTQGPGYGHATLALLEAFAREANAAGQPLPRVRALHLPPRPTPGDLRGEFCALELEDGAIGLSYVLLGDTWAELNRQPQRFALGGRDALDLARGYLGDDALDRTVGFAAINALTRCLFDRAAFVPAASADSIGGLDPQPGETVGMIGYFASLVPRITARGARLVVVELRADLVGERDGVRITLDANELHRCDKVLSTGTLLLNDTLDRMLGLCRQARRFAMIGPSVGCLPDPLFARGVTLLGGTWIIDSTAYIAALRSGESTAAAGRKFALAREDYPGWSVLLRRAIGDRS